MDETVVSSLILDRIAYGERDLILTLLTRDFGVVSAIARSARGSRRRFGGSLDLFVVFNAHLRLRPPPRLSLLMDVDPTRHYPGILEDLSRIEVGQAMLAAARDLLRDAPAPPGVFDLVVGGLRRLEKTPSEAAHQVLLDVCLGILAENGHVPSGTNCPACGRALDAGVMILEGGIVVCSVCGPGLGGHSPSVLGWAPQGRSQTIEFVTRLMSAALGRPYSVRLRPD